MCTRCFRWVPAALLSVLMGFLTVDAALVVPTPDFEQLLARANAGDAEAQYEVGIAYLHGSPFIWRDYAQAFAWLQKAANKENAPAMSTLGWIYEKGLGQPQDPARAFLWYLRGASGGDAFGQRQAAEFYQKGIGVEPDAGQAAAWFKKAALQGDLIAQTRLGIDYLNGLGVQKDPKLAFTYFLKAAYSGFGWAQFNVARCYWLGIFVPHDPVQAYKWAWLASQTYHDKAEDNLMQILTAQLTTAQIREGNQLVRNWPKEQSGDLQEDPLSTLFATGRNATLPFELVRNHIVIQAALQGHPGLHLMVDTGAQATLLDDQTAASLGIVGGTVYGPASGMGRELVLAPNTRGLGLKMGGLTLPHTAFSILSLSLISQIAGLKIDGVLGFDLLRNFTVGIDFTHKTLTLTAPDSFHPDPSQEAIDFDVRSSIILVTATIFNHDAQSDPVKLQVDTGSDAAFTLSKRYIQSIPNLQLAGSVESDSGGLGGISQEKETRCSGVQIGPVEFKDPVLHLVSHNQGVWAYGLQGLVGNEALRRFDFDIDFSRQKIFYRKNASFDEPYDHSSTGLGVLASGPDLKTLKVNDVSPGSPAAKAGFQAGDILSKIDNTDLAGMKMEDVRRLFIKEGLHHVLVVRNGQPVPIEFRMEDALKANP